MLCQSCKKNEAALFVKLAVNNKVVEMHLCAGCAPYAAGGSFGGFDAEPVSVAGITGDLSGYFKEFLPREKKTFHCRHCGQTYHEFKEKGLLGCAGCYESFGPQLAELLMRIHGDCRHTGKACRPPSGKPAAPAPAVPRLSLPELKQALKKAVEAEDYETAAALRDRIRRLEQADD